MRFKVSSRSQANKDIKKFGAAALISINDPGVRTYQCRLPLDKHFNIYFEDVLSPDDMFAPMRSDIDRILSWHLPDGLILVNCYAGQSRSTAVALGLAYRDGTPLDNAVADLLSYRPHASPNVLIARYMDDALGANGQLYDVCAKISADYDLRIKGIK